MQEHLELAQLRSLSKEVCPVVDLLRKRTAKRRLVRGDEVHVDHAVGNPRRRTKIRKRNLRVNRAPLTRSAAKMDPTRKHRKSLWKPRCQK